MVKYAYDAWGVCYTIVLDDNATDIMAFIIAPLFGIEMEGIEMSEGGDSSSPPPLQEYKHPAS